MDVSKVPRRFRWRALVVLLAVGLGPTLLLGFVGRWALSGLLSVSFDPLEQLVGRADDALVHSPEHAALREDLSEARLSLAQAELARIALTRRAPRFFAALLIAVGLISVAAAWLFGRGLARPVEQLASGMERYAQGDFALQLPERQPARDELQFLVGAFNDMGRQLSSQRERLARAEQLAAWKEVAQSLAHELKNPLTAMKMALARLARVDQTPEGRTRLSEATALLDEELEALVRMTQSFSTFAKLPAPKPEPVELSALLREVCALYGDAQPGSLVYSSSELCTLDADSGLLRSVFGNLVKNALEARADSQVEVVLSDRGDSVQVEVLDGGSGIGERREGAALTRGLASSKREGTGLGLSIVAKIVHDHGGRVWLEPRAPRGTRAVVLLPRSPPGGTA